MTLLIEDIDQYTLVNSPKNCVPAVIGKMVNWTSRELACLPVFGALPCWYLYLVGRLQPMIQCVDNSITIHEREIQTLLEMMEVRYLRTPKTLMRIKEDQAAFLRITPGQ